MTWLLTSDLHLTDRPRDVYRFDLFPWLARQQKKYNTTATFLLGDLTDSKDKHSSALVNRVVDELMGLQPPVYVLAGNHDGLDPNNPFFRFLHYTEGLEFIIEPRNAGIDGKRVGMVPFCRTQAEFDRSCAKISPKPDALMVHQTFDGSIAESGSRLSGLSPSPIEKLRPGVCWAGDVHRPQRCGPVGYIGSPYHVRFGDQFTPRVLLVENCIETRNLHFPAPKKWSLTIRDADELQNNPDLAKGDQLKLTIEMAREEAIEWQAHKQRILGACAELGLEVYGAVLKVNSNTVKPQTVQKRSKDPKEAFAAFCKHENVASSVKQAGLELLDE